MNAKLMEKMKNKKKKGFTLIELIIVIAILAILAALALPKFGAVKTTANISADKATAKNIQTTMAKLIAEDKLSISAVTNQSIPTDVSNEIDGSLEPQVKAYKDGKFVYTMTSSGNITVSVQDSAGANTAQVFPTPSSGTYS